MRPDFLVRVQVGVFLLLGSTLGLAPNDLQAGTLTVRQSKKTLRIEARLPDHTRRCRLRIESSRNDSMTRFSTISPHDPQAKKRHARYAAMAHDTWYPAVDIRLEKGMEGVCDFKGRPEGTYTFGGPFFDDEQPMARRIVIPAQRLEPWENSLRVGKSVELRRFALRKIYPALLDEFGHTVTLLSEDWSGTVIVEIKRNGRWAEHARQTVASARSNALAADPEGFQGQGLSRPRLLAALKAVIGDGLRRQNTDPDSPMYGSFFTFYDLDAKLHRSAYWLWGGSPLVKMMIDALALPEIDEAFGRTRIMEAVDRTGRLYLRYQVRQDGHPSCGSFVVIWTRSPEGYRKWVGASDSGIMHRWAIIPLYKATGDPAYLEAATFWCEQKGKLLRERDILPHYYLYDEGRFADGILDETGWDPEGHAALYEVTGSELHRQIAKEYMAKHMTKFQNEDGLWNRRWSIAGQKASPPSRMTRGTGWAMEGLLAMNEMFPDTIYLDDARKMAEHLVEHQQPDGSWKFVFDAEPGSGFDQSSDKATPLWSFLFYRLHEATHEERYLALARKALLWCLDNQYTGPDPGAIGGLVGRTNASMVGCRHYYDATCAYATGFFGLAILEELRLADEG